MRLGLLTALLASVLVAALSALPAAATPGSRFPVAATGTLGVIATESPAAARVGRAMLEDGGNAVDAAAAAVFALGVARPQSCGIGGGGFMVVHTPDGESAALDFRETAPAAIRPDTFTGGGLYETYTGHTTVGVPGTVAGMAAALKRYGTRTLSQAAKPAERLARRGVTVAPSLAAAARANAQRLALFPASAALWLPNGQARAAGTKVVQPDLAATLGLIRRDGADAFYRGPIGRAIVADMQQPRPELGDTGLLTLEDLAAYRAVWRQPIETEFRGRTVIGMPPPTSGGVAIAQMLEILEGYDLDAPTVSLADRLHLVAEAQKLAFADRAWYLADPGFVPQPTARLISPEYAAQRRALIDPDRAQSFSRGDALGGDTRPEASTTHVSVIDADGMAVALTCTVEQEFGSAVVAPGTGILLNNELTDFGPAGTANEPAPGKRPRSSMAPTIVVRGDRPEVVAGAAGGVRIIMGVLQGVLNTVELGMPLPEAVDTPRIDNRGGSDLEIEDARIDPAVLADLEARGHRLTRLGEYSRLPRQQMAGMAEDGTMTAVSDPRTEQASLAARSVERR
ncbi:MAG TPA: gamma-glutamyltransferase [Capillimicrobium sp.]